MDMATMNRAFETMLNQKPISASPLLNHKLNRFPSRARLPSTIIMMATFSFMIVRLCQFKAYFLRRLIHSVGYMVRSL